MQHAINVPIDFRELRDVVPHEREPFIRRQVRDIVWMPRDEVVEPDDRVAVREKPIAEVRPEKPRRARNEDSHLVFSSSRRLVFPIAS
jgi:hypothetical protein